MIIHDVGIVVPLDVGNFRVLCKQVVSDSEYEILHIGIGEVKYHLCASAALRQGTILLLQYPVRMFLIEFAFGIGHFRLNPDAELDAVLLGRGNKAFDSFGQLLLVDYPVAQTCVVYVARIFITEPSVVHDKELASQTGNVAHHLIHHRLVYFHVDTFPAIEQYVAQLVTMLQAIFQGPTMESAAHTPFAFGAVGYGKLGCGQYLLGLQAIGGTIVIDAGQEGQVVIVGIENHLEVAAPQQVGTNRTAFVLLGSTVKGDHDGRVHIKGIAKLHLV